MSFYLIVLFLHITAALGIFAGIGLEWFLVHNFGKVTTKSAAAQWSGSFKVLPPVFAISGILILITGIYLSVHTWGMNAWVISGFVLFLVIAIFGSAVAGKKIESIIKAIEAGSEKLSDDILRNLKSPVITQSLKIRSAIALSIVFIMTMKPGWAVTLESVAAALLIGFLLTKIFK